MSLRRATPLTFNPRGLSDALDGSNVFSGAMASLENLIPDPSTRGLWQCRPAAIEIADFATGGSPFSSGFSPGFSVSSFTSPGMVSCLKIIGNIAYGMIGVSGGKDQPFAFNLQTMTFLTITGGTTAANLPTSPATTGAWVPPTMDLVGHELLVTHPGFTGAGGVYFGWFDIQDPNAITWSGGNLTGAVTFSTAPTWVRQFNQRAYWGVNPPTGQPSVVFSDVLVPRNVTNANQVLTFGDNVTLTAAMGLGLNTQLTGGIVQSLIVFKGVTAMFQVTGDAATSNLAINALNIATGTLAPNTIRSTPKGLCFVAPDGLRFIDFQANVSDPIGYDGMGKTLPFLYSNIPSRMYAGANGSVIRITTQDASLVGTPWVEYWYDMPRQIWSGPHSLPASCIEPWQNTFVVAPQAIQATLFESDYVQNSTSTFVENGTQMTFTWTSCMLPDTNTMAEYAMIESTIYMAMAPSGVYTALALNQNASVIQQATISNVNQATVWGTFTWGTGVWGGALSGLFPQQIAWTQPVVFRRMQVSVRGNSATAVRVGTMHLRYQETGYLQQSNAA